MSTTSNRLSYGWLGIAALALAAGGAGWSLGQREPEVREIAAAGGVASQAVTMPRPTETRAGALTEPSGDRAALARVVGDATTLGDGASCEPADAGAGDLDLARLERTLAEGTETERHAALTEALQSESEVPPQLLLQTYVTDLTESVRLLAFKAYMDAISDDRAEARNLLQSGVYDMSAAVQAESRRRLAELDRFELMLAEAPPQG